MGLFDGFKRGRKDNAGVKWTSTADDLNKLDEAVAPGNSMPSVATPTAGVQEHAAENAVQPAVSDPNAQVAPVVEEAAPAAVVETAEDAEDLPELETTPAATFVKQTPIKAYEDKKPLEREIVNTKVIAIINQKGGVGKSTTAINLSAALGEQQRAVLVIDLDPQGNATSGLGVDKGQVVHDAYDILLGGVDAKDAIIADVCEGMDLIPATINLAGAEVELVNEIARENRLKNAIEGLRGSYDFIFIDCPPALGLLTVNALVAADELLIPIQTEFYALEGVTKLLESMKRVKNALNPNLDIFGVLLTMYDGRTTLSRQVATEVRGFFTDKVFETMIPRTVRLSEAPSFGQPITEYDPAGRGSAMYRELAKEVIERA